MGTGLVTAATVARRARRALRTWVLTGRVDAWRTAAGAVSSVPPTMPAVAPGVVSVRRPVVALERGEVVLRLVDVDDGRVTGKVLMPAGRARDLGRSLIAMAEELEVVPS